MQDTPLPAPEEPPATTPPLAAAESRARPTGVTIIAILAGISGVLQILGGMVLLMGSGALGIMFNSAALGGLAAVVGAIGLALGVLLLAFAWGAWGLRPWAWTLGVVLEAVAIVLGIFNLINGDGGALIPIAFAALITWYLFQPDVRRAFGRA
jgi:hypothetical protein